MFKLANIRKHFSEQSCFSVRVFLSMLAHLAHLAHFAQSFFYILNRINKCFNLACKYKKAFP